MNVIDRAIGFISPRWALERRIAREALATYPDAVPTKLDPAILAPGTSADWDLELGRDRRLLVDRVRQLERENPFANALLDRTVELVVGHGFRLVPRSKNVKFNLKLMRLWREWCRKENCDIRGLLGLHSGMALTFRGYLRDGEAGYIKIRDGTLRTLESDEIGEPQGYYRPGKVDGIDLDERGRPKAFRIFKPDMNVLYSDRRISGDRLKVPAADVIFLARRTRTSQTRGLSAFTTVFWALDQIKGSIEAMTVSLRMAACIGLVIKRATPFALPTAPDANSSSGVSRMMKLVPGGILHLLPGEDVHQITPAAPGPQFEQHVRLLVRVACSPFGLPLEVALGDFGPLNLSSARANLQQALRRARLFQFEIEEAYEAIADWKTLEWIEAGELDEVDDWRERRWVKPKQLVMDPLTEGQADLLYLDAGLKTLADVAEEHGYTLEELVEQRAMEIDMLEAAGLEPARSTFTRESLAANGRNGDAAPGKKPQDLSQVAASMRRSLLTSRRRAAPRPQPARVLLS